MRKIHVFDPPYESPLHTLKNYKGNLRANIFRDFYFKVLLINRSNRCGEKLCQKAHFTFYFGYF